MQTDRPITFLKGYLQNPRTVGSFVPSSRALAAAICEPYRRSRGKAVVLEVGAGTGPMTRHVGTLLGPRDEFDVCELNNGFADVLERDVLTRDDFAPAVAQGRVRLLRIPAQKLDPERQYDFVICGLPFTAFDLTDVEEIMNVIRRCIRPGGVFSYYEYVGLRRASRTFALSDRKRIRGVSAYMSDQIAKYEIERRTVWLNFPPAIARHLRFAEAP